MQTGLASKGLWPPILSLHAEVLLRVLLMGKVIQSAKSYVVQRYTSVNVGAFTPLCIASGVGFDGGFC